MAWVLFFSPIVWGFSLSGFVCFLVIGVSAVQGLSRMRGSPELPSLYWWSLVFLACVSVVSWLCFFWAFEQVTR